LLVLQNQEMPMNPSNALAKVAAIISLGITLGTTSHLSAHTVRTAIAINNIRMATPLPFDQAFSANVLGFDQEPAPTQKLLLKQATEYVEFRRSPASRNESVRWLEKCRLEKMGSENIYCAFEISRREPSFTQHKKVPQTERRLLANDLRAGNFSAFATRSSLEISTAVRQLDQDRQLASVAMTVADQKDCVPPAVAAAFASKLEERFPAIEIVELTKRLYRRALSCGHNLAAAHASFRLGLLHIWENNCSEIGSLMLKVESIQEASQFHARAKFWRYFCADHNGDQLNREFARSALINDHPMSFQALAAAVNDDTMIDHVMNQPSPQIAFRSLVRADLNEILRAVEALIRAGNSGINTQLASEIIDQSLKDIATMEPEVRLYAALVMNRIGGTLPKFKILNELFLDAPHMVSMKTLKLFFPLSFIEIVRHKQQQIDPLLIISLIRQESAFNKKARSIAGARGLMQIMPATARMVARKHVSRLFDPSINIEVGTKYFLNRLRQYEGDVELTLAAYNAGFSRVDDWRKRYPTDNRLLFLDLIPFRETRDYVSSILRNYYWYVKLYSPAAISESQLAHSVTSKTDSIITGKAGIAANTGSKRLPASENSENKDAALGK
jgi:soluble lytic murein transglycosylase